MFEKQKKYILDNHKVDGIDWEPEFVIDGNSVMFVTEILGNSRAWDYKSCIEDKECRRNKAALCMIESGSKGEYRVGVRLNDRGSNDHLDIDIMFRLNKIAAFLNKVHDPEGNKGWSVYSRGDTVRYSTPLICWTGPSGYQSALKAAKAVSSKEAKFGNLAKMAGFTDQVIEEFKQSIDCSKPDAKCTSHVIDEFFISTLTSMEKNFEAKCERFDGAVTAAVLKDFLPRDLGGYVGTFLNGRHKLAEVHKAAHQAGKDALNPNNNSLSDHKLSSVPELNR